MAFDDIDTAGVARTVARLLERAEDAADAYFERIEEVALPADGKAPGFRMRHEEGLAVRLERGEQSWLATADRIDGKALTEAVRRVARTQPRAQLPDPRFSLAPPAPAEVDEVLSFPSAVRQAVRERQASLPVCLNVKRYRRTLLVVGARIASPIERESFYSVTASTPSGRWGGLFTALDEAAATRVARALVRAWRSRDADPPQPWSGPCVLGPEATAVLLHEAVAHALEADTLALGSHPEAAVGVRLGAEHLSVIDDPSAAPAPVRRAVDDEGTPVLRRWLVRDGTVEQPLCDRAWAATSERLAAGAGRRADRHHAPVPRSHHLELVAGEHTEQELLADAEGGLYLPSVSRGHLDPHTGMFDLRFPNALRIQNRVASTPTGPCALRGRVGDLLSAMVAVGSEVRPAGAGWCAKGGVRMPVWATVPAIRVEGLQVTP